jgi:hypothetical protein
MRGMARKSLNLIATAKAILEEIQPATVRAVCYRLFTQGLIGSMAKKETSKVSRLLVLAREGGMIPWSHVVDETREAERISGWSNLADYGETVLRSYRKNFWQHQPERVEVWSEKGTVRGTLAPVLNELAVTFRVMHGFGSATSVNDVAEETGEFTTPLRVLYVGDYGPVRALHERGGPSRAAGALWRACRYQPCGACPGRHGRRLPSFDADTKRGDPRHDWFRRNYGQRCWELDALSPPVLRQRVREAIRDLVDTDAWEHCRRIEAAERESLQRFKWS